MRPTDPLPRLAVTADDPQLAAVLAEAFADDAALAHTLPVDVARRSARLRLFFRGEVGRSRRSGGAWTTSDDAAAAVWYPPGRWRPGTWEALCQTPAALRVFGRHSRHAARTLAALHEHHPREAHRYPAYVGVRRDRRGTGVGSALLQPVLERCDRERLPAYLEASNERNRGLYRRLGFTDREPVPLPGGGPTIYPMWREPR